MWSYPWLLPVCPTQTRIRIKIIKTNSPILVPEILGFIAQSHAGVSIEQLGVNGARTANFNISVAFAISPDMVLMNAAIKLRRIGSRLQGVGVKSPLFLSFFLSC